MKKYHFFWSGPLSQWFKADIEIGGMVFCTCEQYMMYRKAMLFQDYDTASKILATRNPKRQKELGREVKNFNAVKWNAIAREVVYVANYAKFTQNEEIKRHLLSTEGLLVEASPFDRIWGIWYGEDEALDNIESWGTNWLGEILTRIRDEILKG